MDDSKRKELMWKIKKSLHALPEEELFQFASNITPVEDLDPSKVIHGDEESCYDSICTNLNCKTLLDLEDQGFSHLLSLRDVIAEFVSSHTVELTEPLMYCSKKGTMTITPPSTPVKSIKAVQCRK